MKVSVQARFLVALCGLVVAAGCGKQAEENRELAYVAAPQVMLRDRVAAVYNKVGTAKNGEKLVVLDKQKRFVKVRTERNEEGWVEQRYLAEPQVYAAAQRLANTNLRAPSQGKATVRHDTNLHVEPGRETDHLYLINEGEKVEVLVRAIAEKTASRAATKDAAAKNDAGKKDAAKENAAGATKDPAANISPPIVEDWRLVRASEGRVGWVLGRMVDLDAPMEVAQYAEGQRIIGFFVLNEVEDEGKRVPQYLLALSVPKDGLADDFSQIRVFTWNAKRNHYETAYRERNLAGELPIRVGTEDLGKEGKLPVFVLRVRGDDDKLIERKYKLNGVMVRRVLAPGEEPARARPAAKRRRR
ncbi:MAG: SH3 domain-containing protein [Acidobacteriota bacterium]|nr:SH3 domain-containing protein [Acidobacteriota bacterium]